MSNHPDLTPRLRRALRPAALALVLLPAVAACAGGDPPAPAAAELAIPATPDLRRAPWADQPDGSPSIHDVEPQASIGFPPGTTYAEALTQLLVSAARTGSPPAGTTALPPLPREVVYVAPADPGQGIRLSLTAPWGWVPATGAIRPPSYSLPGTLTPEEAAGAAASGVLPQGAMVDVPDLPACEIAHGAPEERVPC